MILTSNRTRELHDALKRRALFHWIGHPTIEREIEIVRIRVPGVPERLAAEAAAFVRELRGLDLAKPPGVAETIDWAMALNALGRREIDAEVVRADARLGAEVPRGHRGSPGRDPPASRRDRAHRRAALTSMTDAGADAPRPGGREADAVRLVPPRRDPGDRALCEEQGAGTRSSATWSPSVACCARPASRSVPGGSIDALRALDAVDLTRQEDVYFTLRQTFVSRHDELELFDRAFGAWFLRAPVLPPVRNRPAAPPVTRAVEAALERPRANDVEEEAAGDPIELGALRATSCCATRTSPS